MQPEEGKAIWAADMAFQRGGENLFVLTQCRSLPRFNASAHLRMSQEDIKGHPFRGIAHLGQVVIVRRKENAKIHITYREDSIHPKVTLIGRHYTKFCPLGLIYLFLSSLGPEITPSIWKSLFY